MFIQQYNSFITYFIIIISIHSTYIPHIIPHVNAEEFSGHCQKSGCRNSPDADIIDYRDPAKAFENYKKNQANHGKYTANNPIKQPANVVNAVPVSGGSGGVGVDGTVATNSPASFLTLVVEWIVASLLLRSIVMFARGNNIDRRKLQAIKVSMSNIMRSIPRALNARINGPINKKQKRKMAKRVASGIRSGYPSTGSVSDLGSLVELIGWDEESQMSRSLADTGTLEGTIDTGKTSNEDDDYSEASTTFASYYSKEKKDWTTKRKRNSLNLRKYDNGRNGGEESTVGGGTAFTGYTGATSLFGASSTIAIGDDESMKPQSQSIAKQRKNKPLPAKRIKKTHNDDSVISTNSQSQYTGNGANSYISRDTQSQYTGETSILSKFIGNLFTEDQGKKKGGGSGHDKKYRRSLQDDTYNNHHPNNHNDHKSKRKSSLDDSAISPTSLQQQQQHHDGDKNRTRRQTIDNATNGHANTSRSSKNGHHNNNHHHSSGKKKKKEEDISTVEEEEDSALSNHLRR